MPVIFDFDFVIILVAGCMEILIFHQKVLRD